MPHIPSIFVYSALAALVAVVGFMIVHRITKPIDLDEHQGFLDAMLNIVGTLVSILLGLLVAAALDHYQSLELSVDREATCVSQVFRLAAGLPDEMRDDLRRLCGQYCELVVNDEWPAMAERKSSHRVLVTYAKLINKVVTFRPQSNGESNVHNALISATEEIGDARRERLLVLHSTWIRQLMPLLLMCSGIVLAFAYIYVRRGAILHGVLICFVAIALGGNLGLVFLLSNPFSGDWKIQPRGFHLNRRLLLELKNSAELKNTVEGAEVH
jgi:hypothetical protein